jgi:hypothetical protein
LNTSYRSISRIEMQLLGLAYEPDKINEVTIWFFKRIQLPDGRWTHATSLMKDATSFNPIVYINEEMVFYIKAQLGTYL